MSRLVATAFTILVMNGKRISRGGCEEESRIL